MYTNYSIQLGVKALDPNTSVTLLLEDRRKGVYILGKTGMGKTVLLQNMFLQDIKQGSGAAYFDPYGETEQLLTVIPSERKQDVVWINPAEPDFDLTNIDFDELIQKHKIVLINLAKGKIGEEKCEAVGKALLQKLVQIVNGRMDSSKKDATDFFVYLDEAPNWQGKELFELAMYGGRNNINLTVAHQYLEQFEEEIRNVFVYWNGTKLVFRCGTFDAEEMIESFAPEFTVDNLVKLPTYHAVIKTMRDGFELVPFQMVILPPVVKISN